MNVMVPFSYSKLHVSMYKYIAQATTIVYTLFLVTQLYLLVDGW